MWNSRFQGNDDLGMLISLAIAVGMLIGAVAAMWIWSTMSESVEAVMSMRSIDLRTIEMP